MNCRASMAAFLLMFAFCANVARSSEDPPAVVGATELWFWDSPATAPTAAPLSSGGGGGSSSLPQPFQHLHFWDNLRALPDQWFIAVLAAVVGVMMLCGTEQLLKICLVIVAGVVGGIIGMDKVCDNWSEFGIAEKVAGIEIGLLVAYISYLGYNGVLTAFGGFIGLSVAFKTSEFFDDIGFDFLDHGAGKSHMLLFLWYSFWALITLRFVDQGGHLRFLGAVSSIFGGALLSSAVCFGITNIGMRSFANQIAAKGMTPVNGPWADFLYLLISKRGNDVGLLAGEGSIFGMPPDRLYGLFLWAAFSLIGVKAQWNKHAWNESAGKYNSERTILAEKLLS